jgi:hypothetical protein
VQIYLNELVAYWLHFEGYKYDQLIGKLVEIPVNVFQKISHVQAVVVATSSQNEHVVNAIEKHEPIRGAKLTIVSCTLPLPTKLVEAPIVIVSTQVGALEKLVIPKPIPLVIP